VFFYVFVRVFYVLFILYVI